MKTQRHSLQERLSTQRALVGLLQTHPNSTFAEMAGLCGFDFLLVDGEHGWFGETDCLQTLRALAATNALAMVRLRDHNPQALGRYLDMGFEVIVAPNVSSADQAETLVRAMDYPPEGTRGFAAALHRATRYGLDTAEHLKAPRHRTSLLVIIESALGVANVDQILAVEGVDGAIIGPFDLSADLGCVADFSQLAYTRAVASIERAASARGKLLGTTPHPGSPLEALLARGHRIVIGAADISLMREAMSAAVMKSKACI